MTEGIGVDDIMPGCFVVHVAREYMKLKVESFMSAVTTTSISTISPTCTVFVLRDQTTYCGYSRPPPRFSRVNLEHRYNSSLSTFCTQT